MPQGSGGTTPRPTPAVLAIAMSATAGKVVLAYPSGASVVDFVPFGTAANCSNPTATLSNTTAALGNDDGCTYTGSAPTDAPLPVGFEDQLLRRCATSRRCEPRARRVDWERPCLRS